MNKIFFDALCANDCTTLKKLLPEQSKKDLQLAFECCFNSEYDITTATKHFFINHTDCDQDEGVLMKLAIYFKDIQSFNIMYSKSKQFEDFEDNFFDLSMSFNSLECAQLIINHSQQDDRIINCIDHPDLTDDSRIKILTMLCEKGVDEQSFAEAFELASRLHDLSSIKFFLSKNPSNTQSALQQVVDGHSYNEDKYIQAIDLLVEDMSDQDMINVRARAKPLSDTTPLEYFSQLVRSIEERQLLDEQLHDTPKSAALKKKI